MASGQLIEIGSPFDPDTAGLSYVSVGVDSDTAILEWIFQAPEAITITKLGYRQNAITGGPGPYEISLQGVDTSGLPDGTIKSSGNAKEEFTPAAVSNTFVWKTLDASYACARGEWLSIVFKLASGGFADEFNYVVVSNAFDHGGQRSGHPYTIQNIGVRTRDYRWPLFGYASASRAYGQPSKNMTSGVQYSSDSNPNEYGMRFALPVAWGGLFRVVGIKWFGYNAATSGKSCTVSLYDVGDPGTVIQQIVYDWDRNQTTNNIRTQYIYFDEATLATLKFGSAYTIGLLADQTGVSMGLASIEQEAAADFEAWSGGQLFSLATRNGGAWTLNTAKRPLMSLIIEDLTPHGRARGLVGVS